VGWGVQEAFRKKIIKMAKNLVEDFRRLHAPHFGLGQPAFITPNVYVAPIDLAAVHVQNDTGF
jgi:hypothetical protein